MRKLIYLRDNPKDTATFNKKVPAPPAYVLRPGDLLYVKILAFDEKTVSLFNTIGSNFNYPMSEQLTINLNSYIVSDSGFIVMPLFGKIKLDSLTINQAQDRIRTIIKSFISNADVIVKLLSFKITFLGEFNKPGNYTIYNNNINVFEAIGLAGDITAYGNKNKLMIVRQSENNKVYYLDLTDRNLIYSELFYLKSNDILIVEPLKVKRQALQNTSIASISMFIASVVNLLFLINYFK